MALTTTPKELARRLKKLPGRVFTKVLRAATGKTVNPTAKAIRKGAPKRTGALSRSFGRRTFVNKADGEVETVLGVRGGWKDPRSGKTPAYYATKVHRKNPFVRDEWKAKEAAMERDFGKEVGTAVEREALRKA